MRKHMVGAALIGGALAYVGFVGWSRGLVYYVEVDQILTQPDRYPGRVRLHGVVGPSIERSAEADGVVRFEVRGGERWLAVTHRGMVPDGFAAGREVVVEGTLRSGGEFESDLVLTKCASKYERADAPGGGGE